MQVSSEMRSILDADSRCTLIVRKDMTVAYANQSFRQRYGYFSIEGRRCHELIFHSETSCSQCGRQCPLEIARSTGEACTSMHQILGTMGTRYVETTARPIRKADGEAIAYVLTVIEQRSHDQLTLDRNVVAHSQSVQDLLGDIANIALRDVPVLLLGESGTGKSVFAKLIHENSRQAARPFIRLYAEELSLSRWERLFLGKRSIPGLIDTAFGGTILIRHAQNLSLRLQRVMSRMLTSNRYDSIQSSKEYSVPFRLIFTSDISWGDLFIQKQISSSFFYALSAYAIQVPALRVRKEDILDLIQIVCECDGMLDKPTITPAGIQYILSQKWLGNCEELFAVIRRVCWKTSNHAAITKEEIQCAHQRLNHSLVPRIRTVSLEAHLASLVKSWQGTRLELAQTLGVSERTLYRLLQKLKNE